jgi:hypothetical protein
MEQKIAKVISVVFHPLLIPSYAMLLIINISNNHMNVLSSQSRYIALSIVLLTSFVLPAMVILLLLKMGVVKSLQMENQHERVLPLFLTAIFFYGTYYLLKQQPYYALFNFFMLGATLLVIISLLINYLSKISIHMVAQGGLFGALAGYSLALNHDFFLILFIVAFSAGLTGFARLRLNAHSEAEVYSGFGLGVLVMLGLFLFI